MYPINPGRHTNSAKLGCVAPCLETTLFYLSLPPALLPTYRPPGPQAIRLIRIKASMAWSACPTNVVGNFSPSARCFSYLTVVRVLTPSRSRPLHAFAESRASIQRLDLLLESARSSPSRLIGRLLPLVVSPATQRTEYLLARTGVGGRRADLRINGGRYRERGERGEKAMVVDQTLRHLGSASDMTKKTTHCIPRPASFGNDGAPSSKSLVGEGRSKTRHSLSAALFSR